VEVDRAFGGLGLEVGRCVADLQSHFVPPSAYCLLLLDAGVG
jgi:hypothetical protein